MKTSFACLVAAFLATTSNGLFAADSGPVRVLFLGHDAEHHPSDLYYPMLSEALGRDAIYFDYVTSVEEALGDARYLGRFDALLLYANHQEIAPAHWKNLKTYVEAGGGFLPIHCASWCFQNEPEFDQLVGGRFAHHQQKVFKVKTVQPGHPAVRGVPELKAWDETYVHKNHNDKNRIILQVREVEGPNDNIVEPEPWTWIRTEGRGRIFYTASGHDERVWSRSEFHQLLKSGILWAIGDDRRKSYQAFIESRTPLLYERRDNIPNYENRPEPLKFQFPLSPEDSMDYTQVPVGFRLELFASEPDIVNPICMAWDERGRLWVAESVDYPNQLTGTRRGRDNIKILEDTDGDGRCDQVKVFASGLNVPTSITFSKGGIIVAHAPDFIFMKDTDGDDTADVREILNTGWGTNDTHAGPSNLRYGFDNKIWGTVGYSGYRGPTSSGQGQFGQGVFKMDADGSNLTFLHQFNNNTWGLGFNETGDVFGSTANNNPAFFCGFPETGYAGDKGLSAKMIADTLRFFPITPNVRQVDAFGNYTAGAGYAFATSGNFPESWRNEVSFIAGPTGNLLGMYRNQPDGSGFKAVNQPSLIASADEWFSPVAAEVGPDGNLWVADWYNFIIQHNPTPTAIRGGYDAERGMGNAHINPNRDRQHGRIYRLVWEGAEVSETKSLAGVAASQLVKALSDDNLFWRQTAQRLLVESKAVETAPELHELLAKGGKAALHAFWTLHGLGELDGETHQAALLSRDPALRKNAVMALGRSEEDKRLLIDTAVLTDADLGVRRAAFIALAHLPASDFLGAVTLRLYEDSTNREDHWLSMALKASAANQNVELVNSVLGPNLMSNASFEEFYGSNPSGWKLESSDSMADTVVSYNAIRDKFSPHSGNHLVGIESNEGGRLRLTTTVPVKPDTDYRLAGWIFGRSLRQGSGAHLSISEISGVQTDFVQWRTVWRELETFFNSGNHRQLTIELNYGKEELTKGMVAFDDISLSEVIVQKVSDQNLSGDPERGHYLVHFDETASCVRCHQIAGKGGVVGPPLGGIASRKQMDYLRQSLVDPQAIIAEGFPVEVSPMPPYGVLLSAQQLEDVLAYLQTLN